MALYTPVELNLKGVFRGYTEEHYILLKPLMQVDWVEADKLIQADEEDDLLEMIVRQFISGIGIDDEGKDIPITKEDFKGMVKHVGVLAIDVLRPARANDPAFLANSKNI